MNKSEAKYHNTAIKMNEALFRLLDKKEFRDISILEICNEAGVNRSTFYAHYENTYDLLQETRDNFIRKCLDIYPMDERRADMQSARVETFVSERYIVPYLKFVKEHSKFFKVFVNNINDFNTDSFYQLLLEKLWIPSCESRGISDKTLITYMSKFYLNGMTAIVNEWINNDCEDDILFICEVIILCVRPLQED